MVILRKLARIWGHMVPSDKSFAAVARLTAGDGRKYLLITKDAISHKSRIMARLMIRVDTLLFMTSPGSEYPV
jgi:hypothetical protein